MDLERDILRMMDFEPRISPRLKTMDEKMFLPEWGGLKEILVEKGNAAQIGDEVEDLVAAS